VARAIRRTRYDAVIDAQGLLKSALMARSSGAPRVIGFSSRYLREPIARFFYTETHDPGGAGMYQPGEMRHVVRINLGLLEPLGIASPAVEFPIEPRDGAVLAEVRSKTGGTYVVLNPGAAWPNKRWPPARLGAIAKALDARHALRSVVLWGPGERELADEAARESGGAAIVAPTTTVTDVVSLVRHAMLMVSGDTGPTHIASAVGTPLVGIYGPTRPERNGPLLPDDVTVSRASVCECHHIRRCRRETMCLLDIQVDEVLSAVERRLSASAAGG
jgi:ADP-heptose:LPS heptosyltransferase